VRHLQECDDEDQLGREAEIACRIIKAVLSNTGN
jgi:hypothetical protein